MQRKSIRAITVTEVCEAAGLNRATFYTHYRDCLDLLEQIENEMLEDFQASLRRTDAMDAGALTASILDMMEANRDLCDLLIHNHADDALIRKMVALAHDLCIDRWKETLRRAASEEVELLFSCLTAGLLHVVVNEFGKHDREKITRFASRTVKSCIAPYL